MYPSPILVFIEQIDELVTNCNRLDQEYCTVFSAVFRKIALKSVQISRLGNIIITGGEITFEKIAEQKRPLSVL